MTISFDILLILSNINKSGYISHDTERFLLIKLEMLVLELHPLKQFKLK